MEQRLKSIKGADSVQTSREILYIPEGKGDCNSGGISFPSPAINRLAHTVRQICLREFLVVERTENPQVEKWLFPSGRRPE